MAPTTSGDERFVKLGYRSVKFPSEELAQMEHCNHLLGDVDALHREMDEKGYLLIRGLHDREEVLAAREAVLEYISSLGDKLDKVHPIKEGVLREGCGLGCLPVMEGRNEISHKNAVLAVLEGHRPFDFFKKYFNEDVITYDYKWLRAIHQEGFTGAHVDNVYMSRGSQNLHTMWTPVGDVPIEQGVLAMCEGSNRLPSFKHFQETYGEMDAEEIGLKGTGWFTEDPFEITRKFGGQWKTTDFRAGDVLIFNMRWQPASHPVDPRYCGDFENHQSKWKSGLRSMISDGEESAPQASTTIEKLKEEWGI